MNGQTPLRHIVYDIKTDLKQTYDDLIVTDAQIAYWVLTIGNRLKADHIGKRESGAFLSTFILPIQQFQSNSNPNQVKNRKHIVLPHQIYDFDQDAGIEFIAYYRQDAKPGCPPEFTKVTFTRTSPSKAEALYLSKYEQPGADNPYFYRVHEYIYFLGLECVDPKEIEIGIYMTFDPITEINLDDPFDFPEELIAILKRQVLDLGRFSLLLPQERVNQGTNDLGQNQVPTNKLVSVNDVSQQPEK